MLRSSFGALRQASIQFRYGIQKNGGKVFQWPTLAAAGAAGSADVSTPNVYDSFDQLPLRFRPREIKEAELELVMMGGVPNYELKKKKR